MSLRESFGLFKGTNVNSLFIAVDILFPSKHLKTTFENSTHRLITHLIQFSKNLDRRCRIVCVSDAELGDATLMESEKGLAIFLLQFCATSIILYMCTEIERPPEYEEELPSYS